MSNDEIKPEQLTLYYSPYCPYCHRVLNELVSLGLNPDLKLADAGGIVLKNTAANRQFAKELKSGGGKSTVPCLSINKNSNISWLYESLDIIQYLKKHLCTS